MVWVLLFCYLDIWIVILIIGFNEVNIFFLIMYFMVIGIFSVVGGWLFVCRMI